MAHAALREILAVHTGLAPADLSFEPDAQGKPHLPASLGALHFNLSHSAGLAAVAVTRAGPVGVDVERVRELDDMDSLVRRFFAPAERAALEACPPAHRARAFFTIWTRKEAYIKAVGTGLGLRLSSFAVSLTPDARLLSIDGDSARARKWTLVDLSPDAAYAGAVAIELGERSLRVTRA